MNVMSSAKRSLSLEGCLEAVESDSDHDREGTEGRAHAADNGQLAMSGETSPRSFIRRARQARRNGSAPMITGLDPGRTSHPTRDQKDGSREQSNSVREACEALECRNRQAEGDGLRRVNDRSR